MLPLSDTQKSNAFPIVTMLLIFVNIVVFIIEITSPDLDMLLSQYALIPAQVDFTNIETLYPFITSTFLHAGFLHIASNLWFLWVFGDNVEERFGLLYLPFYLFGGIVAGLVQYYFDPTSVIPTLGASGSVAAVLGAYMVIYPKHRIKTLVPLFGFVTILNIPAMVMLLYWFGIQLFNGIASIGVNTTTGGVAWFAHIGGFIFGWLAGMPFKDTREVKYRRR